MATLRPAHGAPDQPLTADHTVGRSSSCRLQIPDPEVSGHHAVMRWTGEAWELRDLGSRNGTWVSDEVLAPGTRRVLEPGQHLSFGRQDVAWTVVDVAPPEPLARTPSGGWVRGDDGLLLLPDAEAALVCVYEEAGHWVVEAPEGPRRIHDAEEVVVEGQAYALFLPERVAATREAGSGIIDLSRARLVFAVSQDEEHVELRVEDGDDFLELPHRAHLYVALDLARARLEDAADTTVGESEAGWRYQDDLMRDHRIPPNQFNVVLYRARRQLKKAGVVGADDLFERRRGSGQLRLGPADVRVQAL